MRHIPTGAAVRHVATGELGKTIPIPRRDAIRGCTAVQWDGENHWTYVASGRLRYVGKAYATAKNWEGTTLPRAASDNSRSYTRSVLVPF
jgi:hypothetical protein